MELLGAIPNLDRRVSWTAWLVSVGARALVRGLLVATLGVVWLCDLLRGRPGKPAQDWEGKHRLETGDTSHRRLEEAATNGDRLKAGDAHSDRLKTGPTDKSLLGNSRRLLLTGTFYNVGWFRSHILPLSACAALDRIVVVGEEPLFPVEKVVYACPPAWVSRTIGRAAARLLWVLYHTYRHDCGSVMGYHLMPNALISLIAARVFGRRAIYQMTGGPMQIAQGGYAGENSVLRKQIYPSRGRELLMFAVVRKFDDVIVRGSGADRYLRHNRLATHIAFVPGSIDTSRFAPGRGPTEFDLVAVGRLVPVKRVDRMLHVMAEIQRLRPGTRLNIVGDGFLRPKLERLREALGLTNTVRLSGKCLDVVPHLQNARAFLLTSEIEGLSIAMIEAMACGLPCFAPDVGDLGMILEPGRTGHFIQPQAPRRAAERIVAMLEHRPALELMSAAAREKVVTRCGVHAVAQTWEQVLSANAMHQTPAAPASSAGAAPHLNGNAGRAQRAWSLRNVWERTSPRLRTVIGSAAALAPPEWLLGRAFRRTLSHALSTQRKSVSETHAAQLRNLAQVMRTAYERSTYYREAFERADFHPDLLRSLADLRRAPMIDKQVVNSRAAELCVRAASAIDVDSVSTGGTGGEPLRFYIQSSRSPVEFAYLVASWTRVGYRPADTMVVFRGDAIASNGALRHEYDPLLRRHSYSNFHMGDDDIRGYLRHIAGLGDCFLLAYPSSAYALARAIERGVHPPLRNIRGILAGSETVYPEQRALCERVFGCRYFSWYGHSEKLVLAAECEHSTDYHVWPHYGFCELVDAGGQPVTTPGQVGEIVGTGFINQVMPFIRYRTGDYATYVGDHCEACGRSHMLLRDIRGHRTQEVLVGRDGAEISWVALNMHDDTFERVRQFQFRQDQPGEATLKLVTAEGFGDPDAQRILRNLDRKLDGQLRISLERVAEIPLTPRGKAIYVDQKIDRC